MKMTPWLCACAGSILILLGRCSGMDLSDVHRDFGSVSTSAPKLSSGTSIAVRLSDPISSETAHTGDPWRGVITRSIAFPGGTIPAGGAVDGVVTAVRSARTGHRPMVTLEVITLSTGGRLASVRAAANPPLVADSRRSPVILTEGMSMDFRVR